MTPGEWIAIAALVLIYGSVMLRFWIHVKVKLNELDIKIMNNKKDLMEHIERAKVEQRKIEGKFDSCFLEIRDNQDKVLTKIDTLIQKLNDFQVYAEKNFKK